MLPRVPALATALLAALLLGSLVAEAHPALRAQSLAGLVPVPSGTLHLGAGAHRDEFGQPVRDVRDEGGHHLAVAPAPPPVQVWPPGVRLQPPAQALPGGGCGTARNTGAPALQFCCPAVTSDGLGVLGPSNTDPSDRTDVSGCPFRVYDGTVGPPFGYQFGNAQVAVNPAAENEIVFTSLHSDADDSGPTPRSRSPSGTHTAFTSADQGISWSDQPIGGSPGAAGYGESSAVAMDPSGNTYIAYLWSGGGGNETTGYASTIGLFKAGTTREVFSVSESYDSGTTIEGRGPRNPIPRIHLLYVPPHTPPPDLNATGNLTGGPAGAGEIGKAAVGGVNRTDERVAAVWFERSPAAPYGPHGYPGWIDAAVTHTGTEGSWSRLPERSLIGPCLDASNPVAYDGRVYVACEVDKGYDHRSRARIGDIDIWAIDPLTGNTTLVDSTSVVGGHPMLAATSDGYFALAATRLRGADGAEVQLAFSWYGRFWNRAGDVGPTLHALAGALPVNDAHVTGLSLSERTKNVALVYMEWQQAGSSTQPQPPPAPDPSNPGALVPALSDYKKILAVGAECAPQFPLAAARLQVGTGIDATNFAAYQARPSIYDDFQDGLVDYKEPTGEDVWYFAVNDYGAMQVGAVRANSVAANCPVPPPPITPPPVPAPQAMSLANPANLMMGATVGVAATAMVLYLLTVKRRAAHAAAAEDKLG